MTLTYLLQEDGDSGNELSACLLQLEDGLRVTDEDFRLSVFHVVTVTLFIYNDLDPIPFGPLAEVGPSVL